MPAPRIGYQEDAGRIPLETIDTPGTGMLAPLTPNPADVQPAAGMIPRIGDVNALRPYAAPTEGEEQQQPLSGAQTDRGLRRTRDEQQLAKINGPHLGEAGSSHPGTFGKILHGLATAGNIAGTVLDPGAMALIPGTTLNTMQRRAGFNSDLASIDKEDQEEQAAKDLSKRSGAETAATEESTREAPAKARSTEDLQAAETQRALHPLATSDFELWRQQNPNGTAQDYQNMLAKPLSQQDADTRNAVWDQIAEQYHLPKGQFRAGMSSADASALASSLNNVIGRNQGAQGLTIKNETAGNAGNARADRSYQYNQGELDKLTAPISQLVMRMGRLNDTLAQGTPQADALVAPELLTVMAGGAGSGLRMNEAEIARIVGGRSQWESLRASMQKWSTNPETANSITADQRKQIRALVTAVNGKMQAKQTALDAAGEELVNSDDPKEHRAIVQKTRQALTSIDEGGGATAGPKPGDVVKGNDGDYRFKGGDQYDRQNWEKVK